MELNEKSLEQILTRQRDEYQKLLIEQGEKFSQALTDQGSRFNHALKQQGEEFQNYVGAIGERTNSDIRLLAEAVGTIQENVVELREMVAKNTDDIDFMKMELSIIRNDLKEKVSREEFAVLEARVAKLERGGRGKP